MYPSPARFQTAYDRRTPRKEESPSIANMGRTPDTAIDLTDESSPSSSRKRKAEAVSYQTPSKRLYGNESSRRISPEKKLKASPASRKPASYHSPAKQAKGKASQVDDKAPKEKRLRRFRPKAPQSFHDIYGRALSQRFFVLQRERRGTDLCPEESIEMTGSTGNIYTISIGQVPRCNCPHAKAGNQCKHILYVMKRVLNAPDNLVYQLALVPSELRLIFSAAPPIHAPTAKAESNHRKPVEGDCPICFCEFESTEAIVWCKAACGQNIHTECFQTWARTKAAGKATCPYCRALWQGDEGDVSKVRKERGVMDEGYVNVADQLGISRERDESTYSSWYRMPTYAYDRHRAGGFLNRRRNYY